MSDICIRKSTRDDFDDVLKIGEVLPGVDYIWHRYYTFMDDPNATCYVVVVDKQVVAFCAAFLIDDGQTYHIRAGRVKEGFRGQGNYVKMLEHVRSEFQNVASIKYDALMLNNINLKESVLKKYQLLFSRAISNFCPGTDKSKFILETHPSLKELTSEEMTSLIENRNLSQFLFKSDRIIINWVPLRLLKSNMKYILDDQSKVMATKVKDDAVSLLTVGTPMPRQNNMKYVLDVFGDDVTLLRHHILAHINHVESLSDNWFIHVVAPNQDVVKTGIRDVALELGMVEEVLAIKTQNLLERPFR